MAPQSPIRGTLGTTIKGMMLGGMPRPLSKSNHRATDGVREVTSAVEVVEAAGRRMMVRNTVLTAIVEVMINEITTAAEAGTTATVVAAAAVVQKVQRGVHRSAGGNRRGVQKV